MTNINSDIFKCVRINAPHWYRRSDWHNFLNRIGGARPATWHEVGTEPTEYSDVFFTYDMGEGSDREDIPDDIWAEIESEMRHLGIDHALIWVTNLSLDEI